MASNPGDAGPAAASSSFAAVLTFFSPDDLRRFLDGLEPPYPQYTDTLWAFGVKSLRELAHASADTLRKAGVNNDLHIDNIKASAGAASTMVASGQAGAGAGAGAAAGDSRPADQSVLGRLAALEARAEARSLSYTARIENVGSRMYATPVDTVDTVLADVPLQRLSMPAILGGLRTATDEIFTAASAAYDFEEPAQALFHKLATDLCQQSATGLHSCDTHSIGYPVNPIGKVDIILSTVPKPQHGQVLWSTVVAFIEVKKRLSTSLHKEGLGLLMQRAEAVLEQQPRRSWVLGVVADGRSLEVVRFFRAGGSVAFQRSGTSPLSRSTQSLGLKVLAQLLSSSPVELGYKPPAVRARFDVLRAGQEWQVQPQQVLQERGTPVYQCTCSYGAEEVQAVLKEGNCTSEAQVIQHLNAKGVQGVPKLWHFQALSQGVSCLVIQPYGRPVAADLPKDRIFQIAKDVAITLVELERHQVWHLDVAPSNIIVDEDGKGLLVDFHMAQIAQQGKAVFAPITRRRFMSLSRLHGGPATLSGELESLLYTVLYWFSNGHLVWEGDDGDNRHAAALKLHAMAYRFEEDVLARCRVSVDAKAVVRRLKELFFQPRYPNGYKEDVAAADFLSALP